MTIHHKRTECRACGSADLDMFLELGPTPLANSFLKSVDEFAGERSYPLDLYFCNECALIQLMDVIDPEALFANYIYVTGTSDTIAAHNVEYARNVTSVMGLAGDDLVVEVASNDGSLLRCFADNGVRTLGVEPATNIAEMARKSGIETENVFFGMNTAPDIRKAHGMARAVIGNNVLAHVDDTQGFLGAAASLIDETGMVIVEVPYLADMMERLEYDTVYHEHLCYFSVSSLMRLADSVGLSVARVDHVPVHGGSVRVWFALKKAHPEHSDPVCAMAADERAAGLTERSRYDRFARDVAANRTAMTGLLGRLKAEGATLAAYGAPAKGNTLLNYCGINTALLPYTVDKNPMKVGLYTPGMHLPVRPVSTVLEEMPDYLVILAWNFATEIMSQQAEYRDKGGKFIIPIPEPRII